MKLFSSLMRPVVFILAGGLWLLWQWGAGQQRERKRLETNQTILLENQREYVMRDSLNAVSIGVLTLKTTEIAKNFENVAELVQDMGVRMKRIENISQNAIKSDYSIMTPVRDTIVVLDSTRVEKGTIVAYRDTWIEMDGAVFSGTFRGSVVTYDTLTQVVHRIPRRFLFFRYGTKELRQEVVSSNPNTRLTYSKSLKIVK